ncbi:hypothetical protein AYL99_07388 [Fonsecaea erecta]|uniref:Nuclear fusion protein KAR5 n=1 Tax=Fonsecaea erecta TaxID=1367422 RepID=A0A178ZEV7_9EURO|nr:hypothetical protein AYL99_07388 [Fonsecaea erecta]OAP58298.1 hypothetical protein AYL99_07388 [Fonsecaea erecta]
MLLSRWSRVSLLAQISAALVISLAGHAQAKFLKSEFTLFRAKIACNALTPPADLRWPVFRKAQGDLQASLTDLMILREPDNDPVFEKAMHVVDNLATQSTCHQAAAAQLLVTCKTAGATMTRDQGKHELLERAQSVYAVRVAVCETGEGRAAVPSACKPILEIPQRLDHEIDVVNSKILASCLGALITEHYYWTSYSNSRQDAQTLCQATTIESTRLEALQSYQKLAQLLPELRAAMGSTQSQWLAFLRQQQEQIRHVSNLQQKNQDERQAQHKLELSIFRDAMNTAKGGLHDVFQNLHRRIAGTDQSVAQTREALRNVFADFAKLRDLLHEAIATTGEKHAEAAAVQMQEMNNVHELALATTKALKSMQAGGVVQGVNEILYGIQDRLEGIASAQSAQLASTEHHLQLSGKLSAAQEANLALGEQIKHFTASLASELDTASATARRVSTKLDRVNQALTRFEAVSAVLNSLFAVITIPCQVAEHLHLRLLGLFSMPALLLSFWKQRMYSYITMAFYVFLESLISLIEEHHDNVISFKQLLVAAMGSAVVLCCFLLAQNRPKPQRRATLLRKSIEEKHCLTIAERFSIENRLRHGKRTRPSGDRYRRAATVC